ncbi:MAG: primosomal replication protein N [Moraxellaceae bacterium]|nr:primosomal replication protein N [Moraxellaceae bacterium]
MPESPDSTRPVTENTVRFSGHLLERDALRYTPARLPVVKFRVGHKSKQVEGEAEREVSCEIEASAIGALAHQINALPPGSLLRLEGFLASRSLKSKMPVLHVRTVELLEGTQNGFQTW